MTWHIYLFTIKYLRDLRGERWPLNSLPPCGFSRSHRMPSAPTDAKNLHTISMAAHNKKQKTQRTGQRLLIQIFSKKHVFQVGWCWLVVDVVLNKKKCMIDHILAPHASQPMWCGRHLTQYTFGPTTNALPNWPNLPMVQQPVSCFAMFPRNRALYSTHSPNGNWLSGNCSLTLVHDDFVSWNVATMLYTCITLQQAPPFMMMSCYLPSFLKCFLC